MLSSCSQSRLPRPEEDETPPTPSHTLLFTHPFNRMVRTYLLRRPPSLPLVRIPLPLRYASPAHLPRPVRSVLLSQGQWSTALYIMYHPIIIPASSLQRSPPRDESLCACVRASAHSAGACPSTLPRCTAHFLPQSFVTMLPARLHPPSRRADTHLPDPWCGPPITREPTLLRLPR